LYVGAPRAGSVWRLQFGEALAPRGYADAVVREIVEMGEHYGIEVRSAIRQSGSVRNAVLRELARGPHNLLVMGVSPRPGDQLFLGETAAEMLVRAGASLLFVSPEPVPGAEAEALAATSGA
jgi:nucleotide-binding universal stress UspA family protein